MAILQSTRSRRDTNTPALAEHELTPIAELDFDAAWERIVRSPDGEPHRPRRAHRTRPEDTRRSRIGARLAAGLTKGTAVVIAVAATLAGAAVVTTGAYFTSFKSTPASYTAGSVTVELRNGAVANPAYTIDNLLPLSGADASATGATPKGRIVPVVLRNTGRTTSDWSLAVVDAASDTPQLLPFVRVQFGMVGAGGTIAWESAKPILGAGAESPIASGVLLAAGSDADLRVRFWLDASTPNSLQSKSFTFTLRGQTIQTGESMTDPTAVY